MSTDRAQKQQTEEMGDFNAVLHQEMQKLNDAVQTLTDNQHGTHDLVSVVQDITSKLLDKLLLQCTTQPAKQKSVTEAPSQINQLNFLM